MLGVPVPLIVPQSIQAETSRFIFVEDTPIGVAVLTSALLLLALLWLVRRPTLQVGRPTRGNVIERSKATSPTKAPR